jgi:hypothetical protein
MKPRYAIIGIGVWMVLVIGGWLVFGGHDQVKKPKPGPTSRHKAVAPHRAPTTSTPAAPSTTSTNPSAPARSYTPAQLEHIRRTDPGRYQQLVTDPEDKNPVLKRRAQREVNGTPAYQHIPYQYQGVTVDVTDSINGTIVLGVQYTGSRSHAEAVVRAFMDRYHDSPINYILRYQAV